MPFLLFGLSIIAFSVIAAYRKRHDRLQQTAEENFWEHEASANSVRRQDISSLPYITIPYENFSIDSVSDAALDAAVHELNALRGKKILNLTGLSNTDLKMQYGPANLPDLMEYDQNFTDMLHGINAYCNRLSELGFTEQAIPALEFAVSCGSDISTHYTTLAAYYKKQGNLQKLDELTAYAQALQSLMKPVILEKLEAMKETQNS